jgi:hypothetical protein
MEVVGILYGHLVYCMQGHLFYFVALCSISWPFGIFFLFNLATLIHEHQVWPKVEENFFWNHLFVTKKVFPEPSLAFDREKGASILLS